MKINTKNKIEYNSITKSATNLTKLIKLGELQKFIEEAKNLTKEVDKSNIITKEMLEWRADI